MQSETFTLDICQPCLEQIQMTSRQRQTSAMYIRVRMTTLDLSSLSVLFWQTFAQLSDVLHKDYFTNAEVPDTDKYYSFTVADSWFPRGETSTVVEPIFGQIFLETACEWRKLGREDGSTFEICVCRYVTSLFWEIIQNMPRTKSWWNDGRSRTLAVFIPFIWLALISGVTNIHIST